MKYNAYLLVLCLILTVSCVSTKSTLKNVDPAASLILNKENAFIITSISSDPKYGYDKDYPVNVFYQNTKNDSINAIRFFNALTGPKGEKIFYKKVEICCPFPSKNSVSGAALLDVYQVTWVGQARPITLYINRYEKSTLMAPQGFALKSF